MSSKTYKTEARLFPTVGNSRNKKMVAYRVGRAGRRFNAGAIRTLCRHTEHFE